VTSGRFRPTIEGVDSSDSQYSRGWHRVLIEPRRPESIRNRKNAYWLAVAAVCVGAFMGQLDASIVTVALPTLQRIFHASVGAVTWVGLSYLLVLVATVIAVGRFADMSGRKLLYVYGFAVFVIGSALCGLAPSLGALVSFRALQAIGAAMLQANSVAIIVLAVPATALGKAIGIQGAVQAIGLALGPSIGGLLLAAGGWRLVFFVNVPFGVLGVIAGVLLVPRSVHLGDRVPFDWKGLSMFFPAVVAVLSAISFGDSTGWTSPLILGLLVVGVALAAAFVVRERRTPNPMLDLNLFHRQQFRAGISSGLLSYLVMFGTLFLVPFYLERGQKISASQAGLELMMMPLALGLAAPVAGRLADRLGARPLTFAGMALVAVVLLTLGSLRPGTIGFLALLALVGTGLGAFTPPNNAAIMGSVSEQQTGMASGVLNMTRGMGTALGLALTGLVFDLAGGTSPIPITVDRAFSLTVWFLAAVAMVAGVLAATSNSRPLALSAGTNPKVSQGRQ
jgi:EmrB/QacA subfamily drug resistance transporter